MPRRPEQHEGIMHHDLVTSVWQEGEFQDEWRKQSILEDFWKSEYYRQHHRKLREAGALELSFPVPSVFFRTFRNESLWRFAAIA